MADQTDRPDAAAAQLLFYGRPEVLDANRHGDLGLAPHDGYAFGAGTNALPLNAAEFGRAAVWYPIVFSRDTCAPLAVTGLRKGENLFVDDRGRFAPGAYVPAYLRRYPFVLTRASDDPDQVLLCIDRASPRLRPDAGDRLFDADGPTATTRAAMEFCLSYQRQALATDHVVAALKAADLLVEKTGEVELEDGGRLRLTDFLTVDEARLNALDAEALGRLRDAGALSAAYCQLVSMNCFGRLGAMAGRVAAA